MFFRVLKSPWLLKIAFVALGVSTIAISVVVINFILKYGCPYAVNNQENLDKFRCKFQKQQELVLGMINIYLAFLPPEKRDTIIADFLDQTNTILQCRYMSIPYIESYHSCLYSLHKALQRQDAFVRFCWEDFEEDLSENTKKLSKEEQNVNILTRLIGQYGNHPLMPLNGIDPLIMPEVEYQRALRFSKEECIVDFFRVWAVEIERQGQYAVYQFDGMQTDQYEFFFVSKTLIPAFELLLLDLQQGYLIERVLQIPPDDETNKAAATCPAAIATNDSTEEINSTKLKHL